jgi:urea transport system permease protein
MTDAAALATPATAAKPFSLFRLLGWLATALLLALLFYPGYRYANDTYWLELYSRYMALALFALSVDLVWGYTGLLSLGQGLYFGLGVYMVGYSLKFQKAAQLADKPLVASPDMAMPEFMEFQGRLPGVPSWLAPLIDIRVAAVMAVLLPIVVAAVFGLAVFGRRIKGVYFSLITQALVLAVFYLVRNQLPYTGGVVGMNYLAKLTIFDHRFVGTDLYYLITTTLVVCFLGCALLMRSKFGKVLTAIRDSEYRVLALGYNTAAYKTFIFALAGGIAGLAGALYVSALGTAGPDRFEIGFSIEVVILVAVGGRGTLIGAIIGAVLVNLANTYFNNEAKEAWPIILGSLFIIVTVFMPDGIVGQVKKLASWVGHRFAKNKPLAATSESSSWAFNPSSFPRRYSRSRISPSASAASRPSTRST